MSTPMTAGAPPAPPKQGGSSRSTTALVLGILGVLCCQFCAPFAWYIGSQELKSIKGGASPMAGEGAAKAGMILGIVGTVLLVLTCIWVLFMGGMAFLSALANRGS